MEFCGK